MTRGKETQQPEGRTNRKRSELGDFLRSRRERLSPQDAGLVHLRRRRTPGLRREEVAELAGIGVDWYIRLEQGRGQRPSVSTLEALAVALRLSPAEAAHLRHLTQSLDRPVFTLETVPTSLLTLIHGLNQPAYLTGRRWDVLAWNQAADQVFHFQNLPAQERNILRFMFLGPHARTLFGESWAQEAQRMVAQFRSTFDLFADDPAFTALLAPLLQSSEEFRTWWVAHDVRKSVSGQKVLITGPEETTAYDYATFQSNDDPAIKLALYTRAVTEPTE